MVTLIFENITIAYIGSTFFALSHLLLDALHAFVQVLGLLVEVEVMKKRFHKHINSLLQVTKSILQSAIDGVTHDFPNETTIPFWKEAFYSLVMLEKILNQFHDLCFDRDLQVCCITF